MSESQGNFDLALSRADHDMWFPALPKPPPEALSLWDNDESKWDNEESLWDQLDVTVTEVIRHTIVPINGADKVAQQIKITLLAFLGEWFLDVTFGVPYLEEILVKNPQMSTIETILRAHINAVPHVIRLETFLIEWDRVRRTLGVNFVAQTDYGRIKDSVKLDTAAHV
jgi:hypothetical protein